jgi:hypothetical protein
VKPYLGRLSVQIDEFGLDVKYVGLDAGYSISNICKYLYDMEYRRLWDTAAAAMPKFLTGTA